MTLPTVLVIGFDPHRVPVPDPDAVTAALDRGHARFAEFGLIAETCLIGMDDRIEDDLTAALTAHPGSAW